VFQPTFRISDLENLRGQVGRLNEAKAETALVMAYQELDRRLTLAEDAFSAAQSVLDQSIQHATDVMRGK